MIHTYCNCDGSFFMGFAVGFWFNFICAIYMKFTLKDMVKAMLKDERKQKTEEHEGKDEEEGKDDKEGELKEKGEKKEEVEQKESEETFFFRSSGKYATMEELNTQTDIHKQVQQNSNPLEPMKFISSPELSRDTSNVYYDESNQC